MGEHTPALLTLLRTGVPEEVVMPSVRALESRQIALADRTLRCSQHN